MLYTPLLVLALAGTSENCDLRATIAADLMIMHQSGANAGAIAAAALGTPMPDFALYLIDRVLIAETSRDASARELAAFHFAAEVHSECLQQDPQIVVSPHKSGRLYVGAVPT